MFTKKLSLVVAACNNNGIGIKGQLPWRLKGDMAFFKRITLETDSKDKKNVVIMGRKTWDSIPEKFRPLPGRINVVISMSMTKENVPEGVFIAHSMDSALEIVSQPPLCDSVENLFVIGGSSIYKMAFESPHCHRLYLTRVLADIECDTYLPTFKEDSFKKVQDPRVEGEEKVENDIAYKFEVYEKVQCLSRPFSVMCAMLDPTRGIGRNGRISWPPISKDYQYYIDTTTAVSVKGKKNIYVKGRVTWEETQMEEKCHPNIINIVISQAMSILPDHCQYLVRSLSEALHISQTLGDRVENVWVMGGQTVYQEAFRHKYCQRVYLTRIYQDFPSDRFFPSFESDFRCISIGEKQQENETEFRFEVYERHKVPKQWF